MICDYCPHSCDISDTNHGFCKTKIVSDGKIASLTYGKITALHLDPIEKKPLRHFMPGSRILSVGFWGCNMRCPWCQNDSISRGPTETMALLPEDLVEQALSCKIQGNVGIAYTYNEALTNYDYVLDCALLAKAAGLVNVLVTNGMVNASYLERLLPLIDAWNVDLKTIDEAKYRQIGGDLQTVLHTITRAAAVSHVEVTTLIVPGFNDGEAEMETLSQRIADVDSKIPFHVSRFFPAGEMQDANPTDVSVVYRLRDIAAERLSYVYTGNC